MPIASIVTLSDGRCQEDRAPSRRSGRVDRPRRLVSSQRAPGILGARVNVRPATNSRVMAPCPALRSASVVILSAVLVPTNGSQRSFQPSMKAAIAAMRSLTLVKVPLYTVVADRRDHEMTVLPGPSSRKCGFFTAELAIQPLRSSEQILMDHSLGRRCRRKNSNTNHPKPAAFDATS